MISVLYIDDEPELLELGKIFMEHDGTFAVTTAESGFSALELLKNRTFDAIVSDFQMPEMNGILLLRQIRSGSDVPFILFTGKGREEVVIDAIDSGADFYLQKGGDPVVQFAELGHKIVQAVSRKRAEFALKRRIDLVKQASEISTRFIDITGDQIGEALHGILAEIGSQCNADRCYIAQVTPDNSSVVITHEWTAPGTAPVSGILGVIRLDEIPWLARHIRNLELVRIPDVSMLPSEPEEIRREKARLLDQDIKSLLLIPLAVGRTMIGALGLDATKVATHWPDEDIHILNIYGLIIAGALARIQADRTIRESGELYRTVFESTGTAMMILEEDKTVAAANREMERISGYSRAEIEGKIPWTRFVAPDDIERMMRFHVMRREDPSLVPKNYEFDFITRNGRRISTYITVEMIPGTKKSVVSIIDISREKSAREELIESEEKFRGLAESLLEGIYMIQDDRLVYVNPAFCQLFGYSAEEMMALAAYTDIIVAEDRPRVMKAVADRLSGITESDHYSVSGITREGRIFPVVIHGSKTRYRGRPAVIGTMSCGHF